MRILIASGIYPPEVGGPALYAEGVKLALEKNGHEARLALFASFRKYPSGLRHVLYTFKLFTEARHSDAMIAFDTYSAGLPATFVGFLLRKKVVLRIGGDFVWERYVERTKETIPLPFFYEAERRLSFKESLAFLLVRWMLRHAELAFNTRWLLGIWQPVYGFNVSRATVVENIIGERVPSRGSDNALLLYSRGLFLKNAARFRSALASATTGLVLEEGTLSHDAFIDRLSRAHAVAVPSISDVAPNVIVDAICCGKPFLLTKYSGYAEKFGRFGVIVDPLSDDDIARGIRELADETNYRDLCAKIAEFKEVRTYQDVAAELISLAQ